MLEMQHHSWFSIAHPTLLEGGTSSYLTNHNVHSGFHPSPISSPSYFHSPNGLLKITHSTPHQCSKTLCTHSLEDYFPPSITEWLRRIKKIAEMEDLIHQARDTPVKFHKTWACWLYFKESTDYRTIITDSS